MKQKQVIINTSTNYEQFKLYLFNRVVNESLVKRIMESIKKIGWMDAKPILVAKDLAIIDGQHRYEACKRLGLPIYYVITKVDPQTAIIELNANQVNWKLSDYIQSWAESGVKCYVALRDYENTHKFGMSNSTMICFGFNDKVQVNDLKSGNKLVMNIEAESIAQFINDCKSVPYYKSSYFIKAVCKLFKVANKKQIEKIRLGIISLPQQATAADYVAAFENIANRRLKGTNRVSFKAGQN